MPLVVRSLPLVVDAPATNEPERRYILGVVLSDWLGLDWRLRAHDRSDVRITVDGQSTGVALEMPDVLLSTPRDRWLGTASLPQAPIAFGTVPAGCGDALAPGEHLPVLFGSTPPPEELVTFGPHGARLEVDVFGGAFFMLTRYEELVVAARDRYGRFPASASIAARGGFLRLPVVDAYVELLWSALHRLWPGLGRRPRAYRLELTHDVDDAPMAMGDRTGNALTIARYLRARDLAPAVRSVRSVVRNQEHDPADPCNTFDFLMDSSERNGVRSAFYLLARLRPGLRDGNYRIDHPGVASLMRRIHDRGHEIGLHASFHTYRDAARTTTELRRLREVARRAGADQVEWGGRQHYLRWANPATWRNWDDAGLSYDATLAFAEQIGFRTGTCHPYRVFDLERRRPLKLREHPFHVMDVTLTEYMALTPEEAFAHVLDIAAQCRRFRGSLGVMWHNGTLHTAADRRWYASLVAELTGGRG